MRLVKIMFCICLLSQAVVLKAVDLGDPNCPSVLLVSNYSSDNIKIYDGCSGEYVRDLDNQNLIDGPLGILEAPDGDLLIVSEKNGLLIKFDQETLTTGSVVMGDDPTTTTVESNFITKPSGAVLDKDGFLYAASFNLNSIVKIDPETWTIVDDLLLTGNGIIDGIDAGMNISDDGHLYAPGYESDNIIKINLQTKAASILVPSGTGGMDGPRTILLREEADELLVTNERSNTVLIFEKSTGNFKSKLTDISKPTGMVQDGPDHILINNNDAVFRIVNDASSSEKLVLNGAGNLSSGTFIIRWEKKATELDTDNDGLTDDDEVNVYGTDPTLADTDGDTLSDGDEINIFGTDPLLTDSDADGMPDEFEIANALKATENDAGDDLDNDGLSNLEEYLTATLVNNNDTDGDGILDGDDVDPLIPNSAPVLLGSPELMVEQDANYLFAPEVSYAGNLQTISLSITNKPLWATFNEENGQLSGAPTNSDVGNTTEIIVSATNGYDIVQMASFDLEVLNVNDTPTVAQAIANQDLTLGGTISLDISSNFNDIDTEIESGDSLVFSAINLPTGVTITDTGLISGTPTVVLNSVVTVTATDTASATVATNFNINVSAVAEEKSSGGGSLHWLFILGIGLIYGFKKANF